MSLIRGGARAGSRLEAGPRGAPLVAAPAPSARPPAPPSSHIPFPFDWLARRPLFGAPPPHPNDTAPWNKCLASPRPSVCASLPARPLNAVLSSTSWLAWGASPSPGRAVRPATRHGPPVTPLPHPTPPPLPPCVSAPRTASPIHVIAPLLFSPLPLIMHSSRPPALCGCAGVVPRISWCKLTPSTTARRSQRLTARSRDGTWRLVPACAGFTVLAPDVTWRLLYMALAASHAQPRSLVIQTHASKASVGLSRRPW